MSNLVFPNLPGLSNDNKKRVIWRNKILEASSGKEQSAKRWSYPKYAFNIHFNVLRASDSYVEYQQLLGFINQVGGSFDTFLYTDPSDSVATDQTFGVGNGSATVFQLTRTLGSFTEPVKAINGTPSIYKNGVLQSSGYSIDVTTGIITFTVAPTAGQTLSWTGNFYYRCRFAKDEIEFQEMMSKFWKTGNIQFTSVK